MWKRNLGLALALLTLCLLPARRSPRQAVSGSWRSIGAIQPRISPDGSAIAIAYQGAIWRVPRDGGVMRRLTSGKGFDGEPAWSPDGREIVFSDAFGGALQRIDAQSGEKRKLPAASAPGKLQLHPDERRLLANLKTLSWLDLETGAVTPALD